MYKILMVIILLIGPIAVTLEWSEFYGKEKGKRSIVNDCETLGAFVIDDKKYTCKEETNG